MQDKYYLTTEHEIVIKFLSYQTDHSVDHCLELIIELGIMTAVAINRPGFSMETIKELVKNDPNLKEATKIIHNAWTAGNMPGHIKDN